jgi:hypothetical protein
VEIEELIVDCSEVESGLNDLPFLEASSHLNEAGDFLEAGDLSKAVHVLAVALSSTIVDAKTKIDELHARIGELEARLANT